MISRFMDGEWQTALLFAAIAAYLCWILYRWHTDPKLAGFSLLDLVAEEGKLSSRKFMELGSWIAATVVITVLTIRGTVTEGFLLAYIGIASGARAAGQLIHQMGQRQRTTARGDDDYDDRPPARPKRATSLFRGEEAP